MQQSLGMSEIKKINRRNILFGLIRARGHASKYDLQKDSRFSMSTVISTIDELLADGYIMQAGIGKSTGGRRPVYYSPVPAGGYFIGLEFNAEGIHAALLNLRGEAVRVYSEAITAESADISAIIERLVQIAQFLAGTLGPSRERLMGIGVGAPGLVDRTRGEIVYYAHLPGCRDVPVCAPFAAAFSVPVYIDNNINAMAYAYKSLPGRGNLSSFALISIRSGIGMSCVLANQLYRGATGAAGEIGHLRVYPSDAVCSCGRVGCLDAEASNRAVLRKINAALATAYAYLTELTDQPLTACDLPLFVDSVKAGYPQSLALLDEVCAHLASVITEVVNILNPQRIILSGELTGCGEAMLSRIRKRVLRDSLPSNTQELEFTLSQEGPELGALGAAALALAAAFEPIDVAEMALVNTAES